MMKNDKLRYHIIVKQWLNLVLVRGVVGRDEKLTSYKKYKNIHLQLTVMITQKII